MLPLNYAEAERDGWEGTRPIPPGNIPVADCLATPARSGAGRRTPAGGDRIQQGQGLQGQRMESPPKGIFSTFKLSLLALLHTRL